MTLQLATRVEDLDVCYSAVVLNKLGIFAILIQSKTFIE